MSLIICKKCGKKISDKAEKCIYCGCSMEEAQGFEDSEELEETDWSFFARKLQDVLCTEDDIEAAKEEIVDFINELESSNNLDEIDSTAVVYLEDGEEYDEYSITEDWEDCDEDCDGVIEEIKELSDFNHIICYHNNETEGDGEFELYYAGVNLDVILKATIDGDNILFEEIQYEDTIFCIFANLIRFVSGKQMERFVPLMTETIYGENFCSLDYPENYFDYSFFDERWGGNVIVKNLSKKYIKEMLNMDVKYPYTFCFLPGGEIYTITQITNDAGMNLREYKKKCMEANDRNPFENFYFLIFPDLVQHTDDQTHLYGFITDLGQITGNIKNVCQHISRINNIDMTTYDFAGIIGVLKLNLVSYIRCCEEHCDEIIRNRQ